MIGANSARHPLPDDFLQLFHGNPVVITVHGFLGPDQGFDVNNPAVASRQFHFDAVLPDRIKITDAQHLTQAIYHTEVRLQIQVF